MQILVAFFLFNVLTLGLGQKCSENSTNLGCLLNNFSLTMENLAIKIAGAELVMNNISCSKITFNEITSSAVDDYIELSITGVGLSCSIDFASEGAISIIDFTSKGEIDFAIENTSANLRLKVEREDFPYKPRASGRRDEENEENEEISDESNLNAAKGSTCSGNTVRGAPSSLFLEHCQVKIDMTEFNIAIQDPTLQVFIDQVAETIPPFVNHVGDFAICTALASVLESDLSDTIRNLVRTYVVPATCERSHAFGFPYSEDEWMRREVSSRDENETEEHTRRSEESKSTIEYSETLGYAIRKGFAKANYPLPTPFPALPQGALNLYKSSIIDLLDYVSSVFLGVEGNLPINSLLGQFLKEGLVDIPELLNEFGLVIPQITIGNLLSVKLHSLHLGGIDTIDVFRLARRKAPGTIDNAIGLEKLKLKVSLDLEADIPINFHVDLSEKVISIDLPFGTNNEENENGNNDENGNGNNDENGNGNNDENGNGNNEGARRISKKREDETKYHFATKVSLDTELSEVFLRAVVDLFVSESRFESLSAGETFNIGCLMNAFIQGTDVTLLDAGLRISDFDFSIKPSMGNSAIEDGISDAIKSVILWIRNTVNVQLPFLLGGVAKETLLPLVSEFITSSIGTGECFEISASKVSELNVSTTLVGVFVALAFCIFLLFVFFLDRRREEKEGVLPMPPPPPKEKTDENDENEYAKAAAMETGEDVFVSGPDNEQVIAEITKESDWHNSLFFNRKIPLIVRLGLPLIALFTAAFFLSSNTSPAASVVPRLSPRDGGDALELQSLFDFGLGNTITDMWKAGVYPLAIIVAVFSGAWPYIKIVMLLGSWFIPRRLLSVRKREYVLMALDALGKWSMIDSFMLVMMVVGFRFSIVFPTVSEDVKAPVSVQVVVKAIYGMLSFLLATVISLVLSHVAVHYHRMAENPPPEIDNNEKLSVLQSYRRLNWTDTKSKVIFFAVPPALGITFVFVALGMFIHSFKFVFQGAAGFALDLLQIETSNSYSVFSLALALPDQSTPDTMFTIVCVEIIFIVTVIVFPFIHIAVLCVLWFAPLSLKRQRFMYTIAEILNAWASVEVFVVTLIIALLSIEQFAQFMVEDTCKSINPFLERYLGELIGSGECFVVRAYLEAGSFCFLCGAVFYLAAAWVIQRTCHKTLNKRTQELTENDGDVALDSLPSSTKSEMDEQKSSASSENSSETPNEEIPVNKLPKYTGDDETEEVEYA